MKTNTMMRVASVLLVAVLLSTCAISGTFAKYVTSDSGSDSARVAKFGVKVSVADDMNMFSNSYDAEESAANGTVTAVYHARANLVAPGTKGYTSFNISGTPEVRTAITVKTENSKAIQLTEGTYTLAAGEYANTETTVTLGSGEVYEPIKFYFGTEAITENTTYDKTMSQLQEALAALAIEHAAGEALDETYYIGWSWAFENSDANANFFDTYLAKEGTAEMVLNLSITVTQVN